MRTLPIALLSLTLALPAADFQLQRLVTEFDIPATFADHVPSFRMEPTTVTFQGPKGPYDESFEIVWDGDRAIALRSNRPQLDLFSHDPAQGFTEIPWAARYHNATIWGTRLTTIPFIGPWRPTGTEYQREWTVSDDGQTITLHEWQIWDGSHKDMQTPGRIGYQFTIRCDPQLGYVIDVAADLKFDGPIVSRGKTLNGFEWNNFLDGKMSDVWSERQRYDRTVYTPDAEDKAAGETYAGWASHTIAGDISDKVSRKISPGGFIAFLDKDRWSPSLSTLAPFRCVSRPAMCGWTSTTISTCQNRGPMAR